MYQEKHFSGQQKAVYNLDKLKSGRKPFSEVVVVVVVCWVFLFFLMFCIGHQPHNYINKSHTKEDI